MKEIWILTYLMNNLSFLLSSCSWVPGLADRYVVINNSHCARVPCALSLLFCSWVSKLCYLCSLKTKQVGRAIQMKNNYSVLACFWQECIKPHLTDGKQKLHFIFMNFKWEGDKNKEAVSFLAGAFLHNLSLMSWFLSFLERIPLALAWIIIHFSPMHRWCKWSCSSTGGEVLKHKERTKQLKYMLWHFFGTYERKRINGHSALIPFFINVFGFEKMHTKDILVNQLRFELDWALRTPCCLEGLSLKPLVWRISLDHQHLSNVSLLGMSE